jgi:hypothetical protein
MPKLTLEEVLKLPDPLLNDNFDLHAVGGSKKFPLPSAFIECTNTFELVRTALVRVDQVQMPKGKKGRVTLGFFDQTGSQEFLDAFAALNDNFGTLTIQHYDFDGEPTRHVIFSEVEFQKTVIAYDAGGGTVVERFATFEFDSMQELHIPKQKKPTK